jgi:hypothetical protein
MARSVESEIYYKRPFYSERGYNPRARYGLPSPLSLALYPKLYYGIPQFIKKDTAQAAEYLNMADYIQNDQHSDEQDFVETI